MTNNWQRWKGIMKAYPFSEDRLTKWQPPYIVQPKYDGFRCRALWLETMQTHILLSSEENTFFSVPHLNAELSRLGLACELDGELYNHQMYKEGGFDLISSVVSRTVNLHERHTEIQFHVFDIVAPLPQMKRTITIDNLKGLSPWLQVAPFWLCENLDDVKRTYDKIISLGYEGIIVRHFQAPYETKRSTYVMKFKPKRYDIYEIIGWKEEHTAEGVPKGRIGAIVCASGDGHTFSSGAGLSHDLKESLWEIRNSLPGSFARIGYQHLTSNKIPKGTFDVKILNKEEVKENER